MNDLLKLGSAFALGAIAGVTLIKFLESEKGAECIESFQDQFNKTAENIKEKVAEVENQLADLLKDNLSSTQA